MELYLTEKGRKHIEELASLAGENAHRVEDLEQQNAELKSKLRALNEEKEALANKCRRRSGLVLATMDELRFERAASQNLRNVVSDIFKKGNSEKFPNTLK